MNYRYRIPKSTNQCETGLFSPLRLAHSNGAAIMFCFVESMASSTELYQPGSFWGALVRQRQGEMQGEGAKREQGD